MKKRNPFATVLANPLFKAKVVDNKRKPTYTRKTKHKEEWKR